ncbi:leucine-rich repeat extensin-like protein 3 [Senna tora]|uniref:Cell wall hydroxyproline-rich glycoprotein n=1 Tax=Senna tora TaxID=362788 RepID=A0A834SUZ0_9FABA|nr:leucine-rich repeat extensin-like protein 3 [Senna tora]
MATDISFCVVSFLLSSFFFLHSYSQESQPLPSSEREALEIIIGGGTSDYAPAPSPSEYDNPPADCPPPPPPPCPPPPPPPTPTTRLDRARIVLLKFATTVDDPKGFTRNWKGPNPCTYNGVKCDNYPNSNERAVSGLDFNPAAFSGRNGSSLSLSGILGIPELTFFHANSNNFTGLIPSQITKYDYFFELDLSNNKLQADFPMEILSAKKLVFLDLRFNRFTGPLPSQLFEMDLDIIFVNNNLFCQSLPSNFGSTPARFLTFANNKFTGPIPCSIGQASKTLTEVLFLGNQFSGCLPYEIGFLQKATVFDVSDNSLTGPIPQSFACLGNIRFLNLANNKFYGSVPESVCDLPGIRSDGNLSLSGNYFTEVGPKCKKLIKSRVLDVSKNCIPWLPNQRSKEECGAFLSCVKPCANAKSLNYVPCQRKWSSMAEKTVSPPPTPVTYESLNPNPRPHRLLL